MCFSFPVAGIQRFDSGSPPAGSGGNSWGAPPADFTDKCREILDQTRAKLASDIFDFPVNAALVADYYTIIHHPMDFSNVRKKLDTRTYSNPQEYYEVLYFWIPFIGLFPFNLLTNLPMLSFSNLLFGVADKPNQVRRQRVCLYLVTLPNFSGRETE